MSERDLHRPDPDSDPGRDARRPAQPPAVAPDKRDEVRRLASVAFGIPSGGDAVRFGCPDCGHMIAIAPADGGKHLDCPACGVGIQVPAIAASPSQTLPRGARGVTRPARLPTRRRQPPANRNEAIESRESRIALDGRHRLNPDLSPKFKPFEGGVVPAYEDAGGTWDEGGRGYAAATGTRLGVKFMVGLLGAVLLAGGVIFLLNMIKSAPSDYSDADAELSPEVRHLVGFYDEFRVARSPEERTVFVRHPTLSLPRMQQYYMLRGMDPPAPLLFPRTARTVDVGGVEFIRCEGQFKSHIIDAWFEKTADGGLLVDWESLVGYADSEWDLCLVMAPSGEHVFRIFVSPAEFYANEFADPAKFSCARLAHIDSSEIVHGYAARGSEVDKTLAGLFASMGGDARRPAACLATVRFPRPGKSVRQLELVALTPGWFVPVESPPAPNPTPEAAETDEEPEIEPLPASVAPGPESDDAGVIPAAIPVEPVAPVAPDAGDEGAGE